MRDINKIEYFEGVRILVRVDFNVPVENGKVTNGFRIKAALPTIRFLAERKAKVILLSHLETRDGENISLKPVADFLNSELKSLGIAFSFVSDYKSAENSIKDMENGSCIMLENVRSFPGEKKNDVKLAKELASLADIFVNDAFSVCHREHASVVGIPLHIQSYAGFQLAKEVKELSRAFDPSHPFLFVLGGAKFSTKIPLIERFLGIADKIFIGGALANDFFKLKGYEVGTSLLSDEKVDLSIYASHPKIILPIDAMNESREVKVIQGLSPTDKIVDFGPGTITLLKQQIANSNFILWNGPLGFYENGYTDSTISLAKMMAEASLRGATTILGGGDTVTAIAELGLDASFTFVSTGGGAMLDFLAQGSLPGIDALKAE